MKSKAKASKSDQSIQNLALSIGNFIRYWGFRRIHGAIWAQLYLSKTPLSCTELAAKLALSKSLVSPALEELCEYKLIYEAPAPNEKTKLYHSAENIQEVIRNILKTREAKMLKEITNDYSTFQKETAGADDIHQEHAENLGEMIFSANLMLEMMLDQKDLMKLPLELEK